MMLTISWILTLVVVLTLPLSVIIVATHRQALAGVLHAPAEGARRAERPRRGDVHRATPSSRRSVTKSGRSRSSTTLNETYYDGAWRAQFVTGMIMPIMMFVGNLGYVVVAVIGGIW